MAARALVNLSLEEEVAARMMTEYQTKAGPRGGAVVLSGLLTSASTAVQYEATLLAHNVSSHPSLQPQLLTSALLSPLVALLDAQAAAALQAGAARALTNLCRTREGKRAILESGALAMLSSMSGTTDGEGHISSSAVLSSVASELTPNSRRVVLQNAARAQGQQHWQHATSQAAARRTGRRGAVGKASPLARDSPSPLGWPVEDEEDEAGEPQEMLQGAA